MATKASKKGRKEKQKRFFFSVVEEMVQNPEYAWGRGGRIEVYEEGQHYAIFEARFFLPKEFATKFRDLFDFKSADQMPMIRWDYTASAK